LHVNGTELTSHISSNSFTDSANFSALIETGQVEGKFYGNNAPELGRMVRRGKQ